jgi:ADP-heptose:LPS heptosyltransferase
MGAGINENDYVIAMHPSFSGLRKSFFRSKKENYLRQWPIASFAHLAILLTEYANKADLDVKIIMDLLPDERELGEKIVHASGDRVILLTPKPDFGRYKAVIQRTNLLITPNTGPMHIGGAVGTEMVALFSGMSPDDCGPYVPKEQFIALCAEDTDKPELGIAAISPNRVFKACQKFLTKD